MKYLLLLISLTLTSNAVFLYTGTNHCVTSVLPHLKSSGVCWTDLHNNKSYCHSKEEFSNFIEGFSYEDGLCLYKNDLSVTGLSQDQWDYFTALLGHFTGLSIFFFMSYISILVSKRR